MPAALLDSPAVVREAAVSKTPSNEGGCLALSMERSRRCTRPSGRCSKATGHIWDGLTARALGHGALSSACLWADPVGL